MKRMCVALAGVLVLYLRSTAWAQVDVTTSYFVPQAGPTATPTEGNLATQFFRSCPNNDGASLPNNARIKVVLRNTSGDPLAGVSAQDIFVRLNGGIAAQGFSGVGADSIISNDRFNLIPICPLVQYIYADGPTDPNGTTYITFTGAGGTRDPMRKWGHNDSELPVFALGAQLFGRLTTASFNGSYILRIRNFDVQGGLGHGQNQGEAVSSVDWNTFRGNLIDPNPLLIYWLDLNDNGTYNLLDFNIFLPHMSHNCGFPNTF